MLSFILHCMYSHVYLFSLVSSMSIQHVPNGLTVYFESNDVDRIHLIQKKSSEEEEWEDIQPVIEDVGSYKRFQLFDVPNRMVDIRLIATRKVQNRAESPYINFSAVKQTVYGKFFRLLRS